MDAILCQGVWSGDLDEWDDVYDAYKRFATFRTISKYLYALSCTRELWIMQRYDYSCGLYTAILECSCPPVCICVCFYVYVFLNENVKHNGSMACIIIS